MKKQKTNITLFLQLALTLLLLGSCNYREFCDEYHYEERARVKYIWDEAKAPIIPELLNIEFATTRASGDVHESKSDYFDLQLPHGEYDSFAWNPTENVDVVDRKFYAHTNTDGTLKSVGELYSGQKVFELRSPEELAEIAEEGNTHQWTSVPYHDKDTDRVYFKEVPIIMKPQTREIRIVLDIANGGADYIKAMTSILQGICQSKDADGNYIDTGNINLVFTEEDGKMVATFRVLGCTPEMPQKVDLDITFNDDTKNPPVSINVSDSLTTFNDDLGGERVEIPIEIAVDVKNEDNQLKFAIKVLNWEDVTSGDNNDLEIDPEP